MGGGARALKRTLAKKGPRPKFKTRFRQSYSRSLRVSMCAQFKQKQRLGCIYDSEIQAYLGSGIKKIDSDSF